MASIPPVEFKRQRASEPSLREAKRRSNPEDRRAAAAALDCFPPDSYGGLVVKGEIGIRLRMQSGDVGRSTIRGVELLDERIPSVRACQGRPGGPRRSRFSP